MRRAAVSAMVAVAGTLLLSACAPSAGEFGDDAERFLRSDEVFQTFGLDLPDPQCAEPSSTEPGTTFTCTAAAQDGQTYEFTFAVTGRADATLESIAFADG